jgi:serine/threonine protein kinase
MPSDPDNIETVAMAAAPPSATTPTPRRFAPGTLLASRYRIVSRLGKGGMGEVFRADDLVLGQSVALKFLPESARNNENLLARFYEEVRITRQIAHPNVCRVYDIGEAAGQPFLSMEYIDGEDLSSLLRRIGRLPADKAAEFARKMCAGLAAAHAHGVLHRDLKPANIMIDGRGQVRITDFGLATVAEQLEGPEARHGTPAYMAPEQLAGREVTAQSDIYALGLVLYEMFTGKAPFQADTVDEMLRLRQESRITNPSAVMADLDPAAERAILRCLNPDPKQRPASALDLARGLPGGDPLAAALAAGETPSPDVVASSGSHEALRPAIAIALLAGFAACLAAHCVLRPIMTVPGQLTLDYPPDALAVKAHEIAASLGYPERATDSAWGFENQDAYMTFLQRSVSGTEAWKRNLSAPPSPITYWYRQSPAPIVPEAETGTVRLEDPMPSRPGMLGLILDLDGRLRQFSAVPPQREDGPEESPVSADLPPDWSPLFAAARLDPATLQPAEPRWTPLAATGARAAWTGTYPGRPNLPIRVEAAAFRGKPVYFQIVWPWTTADRAPATGPSANDIRTFVGLALLAAAIGMVRHNWKAGRGDVRGATRVGLLVGLTYLAHDVLLAHHVGAANEVFIVFRILERTTTECLIMWTVYLALEPWVRRYWPQSLIVWSRVLGGRWRDPVVGRDVLIGMAGGALLLLLGNTSPILVQLRTGSASPSTIDLTNLSLHTASILSAAGGIVFIVLFLFLALFLARALLRNQWLAAGVLASLPAAAIGAAAGNSSGRALLFALGFVVIGAIVVALMRLGLLVAVAALFTATNLRSVTTISFTAWYGQGPFLAVLVVSALALWAFRTSLGGRKLLG